MIADPSRGRVFCGFAVGVICSLHNLSSASPRRKVLSSSLLRGRVWTGRASSPGKGVAVHAHHEDINNIGRDAPPTSPGVVRNWNIPNLLTFARMLVVPGLIAIFYGTSKAFPCSLLFTMASVTDFLDGYLARKMGLTTRLGQFLDPVADKLLVAVALVLIATAVPAFYIVFPVCVIITREIFISALREFMALAGESQSVAVGPTGKVKTAAQMVSLTILLYLTKIPGSMESWIGSLGIGLLQVAAMLTVISAG
eukprot:CAMPEP_0184686568 /NCGR_PEP_ID=MMETSP0312-20130426/23011_1 /TAXON_ID=31354 /ORGANISM="Compsopogon coeruleus, Strain SAG 36.94" /LENGTH=253 /DNA_ID=CAMNT_0027141787 /DNA_START=136 /DNA_END=894 /DNA_ORIENTATION=+